MSFVNIGDSYNYLGMESNRVKGKAEQAATRFAIRGKNKTRAANHFAARIQNHKKQNTGRNRLQPVF